MATTRGGRDRIKAIAWARSCAVFQIKEAIEAEKGFWPLSWEWMVSRPPRSNDAIVRLVTETGVVATATLSLLRPAGTYHVYVKRLAENVTAQMQAAKDHRRGS